MVVVTLHFRQGSCLSATAHVRSALYGRDPRREGGEGELRAGRTGNHCRGGVNQWPFATCPCIVVARLGSWPYPFEENVGQ